MKTHPSTAINEDAWKAINFVFWTNDVEALPPGTSSDGLETTTIGVETNKEGVVITGKMSFMKGGTGSFFSHPICVLLSRPMFSNTASVTVKKVQAAKITESYFDGDTLMVVLGMAASDPKTGQNKPAMDKPDTAAS